LYRKKDKGMI